MKILLTKMSKTENADGTSPLSLYAEGTGGIPSRTVQQLPHDMEEMTQEHKFCLIYFYILIYWTGSTPVSL